MKDITKVQIIGFPGAGKSTLIQKYLDEYKHLSVLHLDIRTYHKINPDRKEYLFRYAIQSSTTFTLAESACGVQMPQVYVVKVDTPIQTVVSRLKTRDHRVNCEYLHYLAGQMITADYTINVDDDLSSTLNFIFHQQGR